VPGGVDVVDHIQAGRERRKGWLLAHLSDENLVDALEWSTAPEEQRLRMWIADTLEERRPEARAYMEAWLEQAANNTPEAYEAALVAWCRTH
jgi:hypothetical protein